MLYGRILASELIDAGPGSLMCILFMADLCLSLSWLTVWGQAVSAAWSVQKWYIRGTVRNTF